MQTQIPLKNKLMYKIFIHTLTNAFECEAVAFPRLSNIPTYSFKITRYFEKQLKICARKGFNDFPFKPFYEKYVITACNIKVKGIKHFLYRWNFDYK